jgi:hypothetical protein
MGSKKPISAVSNAGIQALGNKGYPFQFICAQSRGDDVEPSWIAPVVDSQLIASTASVECDAVILYKSKTRSWGFLREGIATSLESRRRRATFAQLNSRISSQKEPCQISAKGTQCLTAHSLQVLQQTDKSTHDVHVHVHPAALPLRLEGERDGHMRLHLLVHERHKPLVVHDVWGGHRLN